MTTEYRTVTAKYTIEDVRNFLKKDAEPILKKGEEVLKKEVFIDIHSGKILVVVDIYKK